MHETDRAKNAEILIVDDNPTNIKVLSGMLRHHGYRVRIAPSGPFALKTLERNLPDLVVMDISMPEMDGYEVCRQIKSTAKWASIPVIFVSALTEMFDKVKAFQAGGADYITKPFSFEEVEARIDTHVRLHQYRKLLERTVDEKKREVVMAHSGIILALTKMVESYDDETAQHLERVRKCCRLLAETLRETPGYGEEIDEQFVKNIFRTSILHDIGKVGISDAIINKPDKLTAEEYELVKTHPTIGARILQAISGYFRNEEFFAMGIVIVRYHHEKWDWSGYPQGLAGEQIPMAARIMAVADVYDAIRSRRCYKEAKPHAEAMKAIVAGAGSHFDPSIVEAFIARQEELAKIYHELPD